MEQKPVVKSQYELIAQMAADVNTIKGWVTFFGVMTILGLILGFGLSFCSALM